MYRFFVLLLVLLLSGCSSYGIKYGYSEVSAPKNFKDISSRYQISSEPDITLEGYCARKEHNIFLGPYIVIPLPIFPSPFGLLDLHRTESTKGYVAVTLQASPTETFVKSATLSLYVDGQLIQPSKTHESENYWKITRDQVYHLGLSCDEIEKVTFSVEFNSADKNIKSKNIKLAKVWGRLFP